MTQIARPMHRWKVRLIAPATGETTEEEVRAYWDPTYENINETVGEAAATKLWQKSSKNPEIRTVYSAVGVTYIGVVGS